MEAGNSTGQNQVRPECAPVELDAGKQNLAAGFQRADFFCGKWKTQLRHDSSRHHFDTRRKTEFVQQLFAVVPRQTERAHIRHAETGDDG